MIHKGKKAHFVLIINFKYNYFRKEGYTEFFFHKKLIDKNAYTYIFIFLAVQVVCCQKCYCTKCTM